MADRFVSVSPEGLKSVEESLTQLKRVLDDKDAMLRAGVFTKERLDEMQITYDATVKMYNLYAPKPFGSK